MLFSRVLTHIKDSGLGIRAESGANGVFSGVFRSCPAVKKRKVIVVSRARKPSYRKRSVLYVSHNRNMDRSTTYPAEKKTWNLRELSIERTGSSRNHTTNASWRARNAEKAYRFLSQHVQDFFQMKHHQHSRRLFTEFLKKLQWCVKKYLKTLVQFGGMPFWDAKISSTLLSPREGKRFLDPRTLWFLTIHCGSSSFSWICGFWWI